MSAPTLDQILDGIGEAIIAALYALDDSEQVDGDDFIRVPLTAAARLERALDVLEGWPDEPGCVCGPAASAQWAIKSAITKEPNDG